MVKDTRETIVSALFKIASENPEKVDITLSEIAKMAGVSRQAIYQKHFSSVEEIFQYIHTTIDDEILEVFVSKVLPNLDHISIYQGITDELIPIIYRHRHQLRVLYNTHIDPHFENFLYQRYWKATRPFARKILSNRLLSSEQLFRIIFHYILSIISVWLSDTSPEPPEIFSQTFLRLMELAPEELRITDPETFPLESSEKLNKN